MSSKTYTVEYINPSGHTSVEMKAEDILDEVNQSNFRWMYYDDQYFSDADMTEERATDLRLKLIAGIQIEKTIRVVKAQQSQDVFTVKAMTKYGDNTLQMSSYEVLEQSKHLPNNWVFVDNQLIAAENILGTDFGSAEQIMLMPGLVGGQ